MKVAEAAAGYAPAAEAAVEEEVAAVAEAAVEAAVAQADQSSAARMTPVRRP